VAVGSCALVEGKVLIAVHVCLFNKFEGLSGVVPVLDVEVSIWYGNLGHLNVQGGWIVQTDEHLGTFFKIEICNRAVNKCCVGLLTESPGSIACHAGQFFNF